MEAIGLFGFFIMCIFGLILFLAMLKIFSISHNIFMLKQQFAEFTKYYYDLQKFRNSQEAK